jgi:hypothetical protein
MQFLPQNTSSIQSMDQEVVQAFKSRYVSGTFRKLINETESKEEANVKEFWKKFNIKMAIKEAWNDVMQLCFNGVWKDIWPAVVEDFQGLTADQFNSDARCEIVRMAKSVGFGQVDEENMAELLDSHRRNS